MPEIYLDGDFNSGKGNCEHHCSPSCHPAQLGPDWKYGCRHKAWPQNRHGDFVPIVECNGRIENCEIPVKLISSLIGGKKRRLNNLKSKIEDTEKILNELITLKSKIQSSGNDGRP